MARARRQQHQQQELRFGDKNGQRRGRIKGDKRWRNAGRKPKGRRGSPHTKRPVLEGRFPVHVSLRVNRAVGSLRKRHMYKAFHAATIAIALRGLHEAEGHAFRIVHASIQRDHVHLIVEAANQEALSRGMQRFQISAAKHINREYSLRAGLARRRRGNVFVDRFHEEIITSLRQARHAVSYVLNNWRKHDEDRSRHAGTWNVDPFSTGVLFCGWKEHADQAAMWRWRDTYDPLFVYRPTTWLLREVTRRSEISFTERPGSRPSRTRS